MKSNKVRIHLSKKGQKFLLGPKAGAATTVLPKEK